MRASLPQRSSTQSCLVCLCRTMTPILRYYSEELPKSLHKVAVCTNCGHMQHFPILSKTFYEKVNDRKFNAEYMQAGVINSATAQKKIKKLDKIISSHLKQEGNVLDVGAGEAWSLKYFLSLCYRYFAIERVDDLASSIRARGGVVLGRDLSDLERATEDTSFDFILFRHVLEHVVEPREILSRLKALLAEDGLMLIVVPNSATPSIHKGFRTSFIRPVHISYFCETTLARLMAGVGLDVVYRDTVGEISFLVKAAESSRDYSESAYPEMKKTFLKKARERQLFDVLQMLRGRLYATLSRIFKAC